MYGALLPNSTSFARSVIPNSCLLTNPAGCLWQLDGEAFRGAIARSKQDLKGLVKNLRSVGQLQALSVSQLEVLAEAMQPVSMRPNPGSSLPEVV